LLVAILVAGVLDAILKNRNAWKITVVLLMVLSAPWLLMNDSRELFTRSGNRKSIFIAARDEQYFANNPGLYEPARDAITAIAQTNCRTVALRFVGDAWEYPFWQLARSQDLDIRFEHYQLTDASRLLGKDLPSPCIILNQEQLDVSGLETKLNASKIWQEGAVSLFRPKS
jgi:hypothetical protein